MKDTESGYKYDNKRQKELEEALRKYFLEEEYSLSTTDLSPTRYRSWINCHTCFVNLYNKYHGQSFDDVPKQTQTECLLQLGFYLGNWGMFRKSFISQYDYELYRVVYKVLLNDDYQDLLNLKVDTITQPGGIEKITKLLIGIRNAINTALKPYCNRIAKAKGLKNSKVSITLITKILLVTFACVPAYDENFVAAIDKHCNHFSTKSNIENLLKLIKDNREFYLNLSDQNSQYPLMKIIDAMFWKLGDMMKKGVAIN